LQLFASHSFTERLFRRTYNSNNFPRQLVFGTGEILFMTAKLNKSFGLFLSWSFVAIVANASAPPPPLPAPELLRNSPASFA
jgi:hypothetical protein